MNGSSAERRGFKNVFVLGMVSLFSDLSSQMIYPLIPEYLAGLGVAKAVIGVIEGVAESAASLLRTVFGRWSDRAGKRKIFIYFGYGISALAKPFLYFATSWHAVMAVRFWDRAGKAMRTPARDALISTSIDVRHKGRAFGFHRAMDRVGAIGGPLLALLVLFLFRGSENRIRLVFLFSFIPAMMALLFIPYAKETAREVTASDVRKRTGLRSSAFIMFLISSVVFTFGNASNAFLVLKAREAGLPVALIPAIWVFYNIFCTASSPILGTLSDRAGRPLIIAVSFVYYAVVYVLFGLCQSLWAVWILFAAYGIYYGLSEGVFRAYIADLVEADYRATAYGVFNTGVGLALIPASIIFGALWDTVGSRWAFSVSACFSMLGFLIFIASIAVKRGASSGYDVTGL